MNQHAPQRRRDDESVDAIVVGAGFAGMYALYRLRELRLRVKVFEAGGDVGGTWYWNRYPGARCDTNSLFYCYSFSPELRDEWTWTERYPSRDELLAYLGRVADMFDLRRDIDLNTRVSSAEYDESTRRWVVHTADGRRFRSRYFITAVGCLSDVQLPHIAGLDTFEGEYFHTARWPDPGPDFNGEHVGVIGTGSSGVQVIPEIARKAKRLFVFQRTPNYVLPARNAALEPDLVKRMNDRYAQLRQQARESASGVAGVVTLGKAIDVSADERRRVFQERWDRGGVSDFLGAFSDLRDNPVVNESAAAFIREKIREIVHDSATAELLCPTQPLGAKRTPLGTDYYETFNLDNVELIDIRAQALRVLPHGVKVGGKKFGVSQLVFATGFDAITGPLFKIDICGVGGATLRSRWQWGPRTYLGLTTTGFPNMFMITGPQSPSVLGNVVVAIEQHVEWVARMISYMEARGIDAMEPLPMAEDRWVAHVNEVGSRSVISTGNSWYVGANVPGKPRVFLPYAGGYGTYAKICDSVAEKGYDGFAFRGGVGVSAAVS